MADVVYRWHLISKFLFFVAYPPTYNPAVVDGAMTTTNSLSYTSLLAQNQFKPGEKLGNIKDLAKRSVSSMGVNRDARSMGSQQGSRKGAQSNESPKPRLKITRAEEDALLQHVGSWTKDCKRTERR
ncbi:hypothetical protein B0A48_09242 [Cryoendolithus antarcticus]|uniref:Uncharacterized protein n=1 Tax=Cryoendolithus antarcticus TaxID=1507870 RepID=A0A1V8T213_9PEZI|nr:hypothetical protein B0A48_09242 [Cryoendolithus antarcticus]